MRMPESKDTRLRYVEPADGRRNLTETRDGRHLLPMSRNSSQHIPEFRFEQSPDPWKQHILESRGNGRAIPEAKDVRHHVPEPRASNSMTRMESVINPYSPWTLDRLRQRSPDESLATSRGPVPHKREEIIQIKIAVGAYDDVRTSTYMNKYALEFSRPMRSSHLTKMAPPVGQMKPFAPVTSPLPLPGSLTQKSSYVVADQVTVDNLLRSLGLEKYAILFKAEEVDMYSLKRMAERDPMGPRKKILLSLQPRLKQQA